MRPLCCAMNGHGLSLQTVIAEPTGIIGRRGTGTRTADGGEISGSLGPPHAVAETLKNGTSWANVGTVAAPLPGTGPCGLVNGVAISVPGYQFVANGSGAKLSTVDSAPAKGFTQDELNLALEAALVSRRRKLKVYKKMLSKGRLAECLSLLEEVKRCGPILSHEVNHSGFFRACREQRAVPEAFRFMRLVHQPSLSTFNMLLSVCTEAEDTEGALRVMSSARKSGLKPDCALHTNLIDCFCKAGKLDTAFKLYHEMEASGVEPNVHTFSTMISGCAKANQVSKAFGVYGIMLAKGLKPDRVLYNTLITACGRAGTLERAFDVLRDMHTESVLANSRTMCALIDASTRAGDATRALEVYKLLSEKKINPSTEVYTSAVHACSLEGDLKKALAICEEMKSAGAEPDEVFYSALIDVAGHANEIEAAFEIFNEMRSLGFIPTAVSYSAVMGVCCNARYPTKAVEVYNEMKANRIKPTVSVFNALMTALVESSQLNAALAIMEEMQEAGVPPNQISYTILLSTCARMAEAEIAFELFSGMRSKGVSLNLPICNSMISVCLSQIRTGRPPIRHFLGIGRATWDPSLQSPQQQWASWAMVVYRQAIAAGVAVDVATLGHLLACLRTPAQRLNVGEPIYSPLYNNPRVSPGMLSVPTNGSGIGASPCNIAGLYDARAAAIYEEATAMGVVPQLDFLSASIDVNMESMPSTTAEVCILTIIRGLKRRRAADPKACIPAVNMRFGVEKLIVNLNNNKAKEVTCVGRTGQAVAALLRRLDIPYHGHQSTGRIRIVSTALADHIKPPPYNGYQVSREFQVHSAGSAQGRLAQSIVEQQRSIRYGEVSQDRDFLGRPSHPLNGFQMNGHGHYALASNQTDGWEVSFDPSISNDDAGARVQRSPQKSSTNKQLKSPSSGWY